MRSERRDGRRVWIKEHGSPGATAREATALPTLGPMLAEVGVAVPDVLEVDPDAARIVLGHLDGSPWTPTPDTVPTVVQALRALQRVEVPVDPMPLHEAVRRRWLGARRRAEGVVDAATVAAVGAVIDDGRAFRGVSRVWAHRDPRPDNWRVTPAGGLGLLDFEHARPDAPELDRVRLEAALPDDACRRALAEAWPVDARRRRALLALHGLGTLIWAARHGDDTWRAEGAWAIRQAGLEGGA